MKDIILLTMKFLVKLLICMASFHASRSLCLPHGRDPKNGSTLRRTVTTAAWSSSTDNDGSSSGEESKKSIADYTLGLHGGKYQFGDSSGFSFAGQEFAAALYSSGETEQVDYASEDLPDWAVRLSDPTAEWLKQHSCC